VAAEIGEQVECLGGELHQPLAAVHLPGQWIEAQIAEVQGLGSLRLPFA
jgi:hypothetical protein